MTPHQVFLVQGSFARVLPRADEVATRFYAKLFAADPNLRSLFRGDMVAQRRMLLAALAAAVGALARPQAVVPKLEELGRRHAGYGVKEADYATVGDALLGTLKDELGDGFTGEVEAAWAACYALVAGTMQQGAAAAALPAAA